MAAPTLLRSLPLARGLRVHPSSLSPAAGFLRRRLCGACTQSTRLDEAVSSSLAEEKGREEPLRNRIWDDPDYRKWKDKEEEILGDVGPTISLTKEILHSGRYMDGERLTAEDEETVVEKLLAHHPNADDKIGCGLDGIMVDRHPRFRQSRCLFVVRTDGGWIDFSYQKCLRAYIRAKYPTHAERFIREHFKRGSG